MKRGFPVEPVYQIFSLAVVVIVVHAFYVAVVRPSADAFIERETARMQVEDGYVARRSGFVMIRDYEQEACFVLMLWALAIMGYKAVAVAGERRLLGREWVDMAADGRIFPEQALEVSGRLQNLSPRQQRMLLPRALLTALHRFGSTCNIQDVAVAVRGVCQAESERLDTDLSMIRYITWAIPSIGFIGTVRGIGEALGQAHLAVAGDITGVTLSLGVAFNSTLIALLISIVLVFVVHQLQALQEGLVLDAQGYCDEHLIRYLQAPNPALG